MPRWYPLCNGNGAPACTVCRRHASNNPADAGQPGQAMTMPELIGTHCNRFMEMPPLLGTGNAVTPTDSR